jgi:hypothetical protein
MTKRLKVLLTVMVAVFSLLAIELVVVLLVLGLNAGSALRDFDVVRTIGLVAAILVLMGLPVILPWVVSIRALRLKRREEKGLDVSPRSKRSSAPCCRSYLWSIWELL